MKTSITAVADFRWNSSRYTDNGCTYMRFGRIFLITNFQYTSSRDQESWTLLNRNIFKKFLLMRETPNWCVIVLLLFPEATYPKEMPRSHPVRMKFQRCSAWTFHRNITASWSNISCSYSRLEKCWHSHPVDWNFRHIPTFVSILRSTLRCLEPYQSIDIN